MSRSIVKQDHVQRRVGFTGTREQLTVEQKASLIQLLEVLLPTEFHHGDCVGADAYAAEQASLLKPKPIIHRWPPLDQGHQARTNFHDVDHEPQTMFARNRCIVNGTEIMVGCTLLNQRQESGGTWYTLDFALKKGRPCYVVWRDGKVELLEGK